MSTIQERVALGAEWLNDVRPGWRDQVSLDALTLLSENHCVMGQVFGLEAEKSGFRLGCRVMLSRGIDCTEGIGGLGFNPINRHERAELEAEWRRVIHSERVRSEPIHAEMPA